LKDNSKNIEQRKTPPISPHRNPMKNLCPLLIDYLKITENDLWPNIAHCPANKITLSSGPAKKKGSLQLKTHSHRLKTSSHRSDPLSLNPSRTLF
jgi:hypothetical protein